MNVNDKKLEVSFRTPVLEVDGFYTCEGAVYELPLASDGRFTVTMSQCSAVAYNYRHRGTANLVLASPRKS